jgi:hypothetical protein
MSATLLDRVVRWNLDLDGDSYGDERERLRWYEGMAFAAALQWLTVPWAAAVLVWILGRPAVLPLAVVLVATAVPMALCTVYVRRRRVEPVPRRLTTSYVLMWMLTALPYAVFTVGAYYVHDPESSAWLGAGVGGVVGGAVGVVAVLRQAKVRRQREAAVAAEAGDED